MNILNCWIGPQRLFGLILNYEHSPSVKSASTREISDEQDSFNHSEPNTSTLAQCGLQAKGVSDRGGGGTIDRSCTQARSQWREGCCGDLACVSTWVTAAELCQLRWSQIDLRHGRLHVNRAKGGIESVHPLHGPELRALRPLQGASPYVFVTEAGTPATTAWFLRMVQRTGKAAKLPFPVHPHMLRHSTGYKLANDGHDTRSLAHYLGHRNLQSTARYTALAPDRFATFWQD